MTEAELPEHGRNVRVILKKDFYGIAVSGKTTQYEKGSIFDGNCYKPHSIFFQGYCEMGYMFLSRETFLTHVESWDYEE